MKAHTPPSTRRAREKAELSRQGAKSAARGERRAANPMEEAKNSPASTGETQTQWRGRRDAWQAGFDQQSKTAGDSHPAASPGRDDELD